eukprot:3881758-Rhodomonas_salina.1
MPAVADGMRHLTPHLSGLYSTQHERGRGGVTLQPPRDTINRRSSSSSSRRDTRRCDLLSSGSVTSGQEAARPGSVCPQSRFGAGWSKQREGNYKGNRKAIYHTCRPSDQTKYQRLAHGKAPTMTSREEEDA